MLSSLDPQQQRDFALEVVRRLREANYQALWAGGCVRDRLLGKTPMDYDVATDALPQQVRHLFGRRRTLAIGAVFGVITVAGPRKAGLVEVATFRRDAEYTDGRHPDSVTFSSPKEDAARRDFTINGLFYDPIDEQLIDYVGGQADLDAGVIRAIGDARQRFHEDKLRLLRAVRFASTLGFELHADTLAAVREMAAQIEVVSPERIAAEMRRLLTDGHRARGIRLLLQTSLAEVLLPEIVARDDQQAARLEETLNILQRLDEPDFPLALAALLHRMAAPADVQAVAQRWRLSNKETARAVWLAEHHEALHGVAELPWSRVQPILVDEAADDLLELIEAARPGNDDAEFCRSVLTRPREQLDPAPLLTGDDLLQHGLRPGPRMGRLLRQVRAAQLDNAVQTQQQALDMVDRLLQQSAAHGEDDAAPSDGR